MKTSKVRAQNLNSLMPSILLYVPTLTSIFSKMLCMEDWLTRSYWSRNQGKDESAAGLQSHSVSSCGTSGKPLQPAGPQLPHCLQDVVPEGVSVGQAAGGSKYKYFFQHCLSGSSKFHLTGRLDIQENFMGEPFCKANNCFAV